MFVLGSDASLSGVVVRDILPDGSGKFGRGIQVQLDSETNDRGNVQVTASVVERTHQTGVFVLGSDASLSGVVVRDILPDGSGKSGRGISVQSDPDTNQRAKVRVITSVVERTHEFGVFVAGSDAELSRVVVRDILPNGAGIGGLGVQILPYPETNNRANMQVTASVVERAHHTGVLVLGSNAELSGVVVRDILPDGSGKLGRGIQVQLDSETNERGNVQVTASVVERTHDIGVYVSGSDAKLSGVVVRDILPEEAGTGGRGISVQNDPATNERANVQVTASIVERTRDVGCSLRARMWTFQGSWCAISSPTGQGILEVASGSSMVRRRTSAPACRSSRRWSSEPIFPG